jgi:energy-coupling factor transport system substrate-specific component
MYDFHNVALSPNQSLFLNVAILSIIVLSLIRSERSLRDQSQWGMLVLLAVFGVSGRILLDPIPNVQPVTVLVLLAGAYYGAPRALALAATIALASNVIFLGHGPWTLFQAIGWGAIGLVGANLSNHIIVSGRIRIGLLAIIAAASGLAFNWFVSLSILFEADSSMLVPYLLNGLVFDLYHAAGNVVFVAWMASPLGEMMARHRSPPAFELVREGAPN